MKRINGVKNLLLPLVLVLFVSSNLAAQTKVVVIPLAGDDVVRQPSFRLVPTTSNQEAATSGRLEFTSDSNPSPKSNWGKVCDDCFEGDNNCGTNPVPRTHAAAVVVCKDMGYETGISLTAAPSSGGLGFSLDNVTCPDGANSFDDCSSAPVNTHNCNLGEEVDVQCFTEAPKIVFSGFTLDCANEVNANPFGFSRINDNDLNNPVLEATFDDDVVRSIASVDRDFGDVVSATFILEPSGGGTGRYILELNCDTGAIGQNTSDVLSVSGTSGLRWLVSTSVSNTATTITVNDIVFELTP